MTSGFSLKSRVLASIQYRLGSLLFKSGIAGWHQTLHGFAMRQLQRASHKQHEKAQQLIGVLLMYRGNTVIDKKAGVLLLQTQAEQGDAQSQFLLAEALLNRQLLLQDNEQQAVNWYFTAAKQGHAMAALRLSKAYQSGQLGLKQDEQQAIYWSQQFMQNSKNMSSPS